MFAKCSRVVFTSMLFSFLYSCSDSSNLNKIIYVGEKDEKEIETLMIRAEIAYDRGRTSEAMDLASLALDKSPSNERAAVLLGFVSLSQAGMDPFKLADKLILLSSKTATTSSDGCSSLTSSASSSSAADVMGSLKCLLNLSTADMANLGTKVESAVSAFDSYPVLEPKAPGTIAQSDSARSKVPTLYYLNRAIAYLCPFINEPSSSSPGRSADDPRHSCQATPYARKNMVKSHFAWAMAHLVESLAFYNVLLYKESASSTTLAAPSSSKSSSTSTSATSQVESNLAKRVTALDTIKNSSLTTYITAVTEVKSNFDAVFKSPGTGEDVSVSMLQSTLLDLKITTLGFGAIPGIPASMTESITTAIDSITSAAGQASDLSSQASVLQGQLTQTISQNLKTSIDSLASSTQGSQVTTAQKTELCTAFSTISVGTSVEKPTMCK